MKRLHVHVSVKDLDASVRFYSQLFALAPTVHKTDYAKWMLEDPRVNFAISRRDDNPGVQHLGIQVENRAELKEMYQRLQCAKRPVLEEGRRLAATPTVRKAGLMIRRAFSGRRFSLQVRAQFTERMRFGTCAKAAAPRRRI